MTARTSSQPQVSSTPDATAIPPLPAGMPALESLIDGHKAFQVLRSALSLGLFEHLDRHGPQLRPELAQALGLRGAHLSAWLQALCDLDCLRQDADNRYALDAQARPQLLRDSPWYIGEYLDALAQPDGRWARLDDFMHETRHEALAPLTTQRVPALQHPLRADAWALADWLAAHHQGKPINRLLCCDASDGLLSARLTLTLPVQQTLVRVPEAAMARTQANLAWFGVADRCRVEPDGPPTDAGADAPWDMAILFHSQYPRRRTLSEDLSALSERMAPGGLVCSAHWFCAPACAPAEGGLGQMDQAILTDSHPLCHVEKFCERLEGAGLVQARQDVLQGRYGPTLLHSAVRP